MNKLNIINKMRNKLTKNIINKQWFGNYKYKKTDFINFERFMSSSILSFFLTFLVFILNDNLGGLVKELNIFFGSFLILVSLLSLNILNLFSLWKIENFFMRRNIKKFIKKSKNFNNEDIVKLMNGSKKFIGSETLVSYINNQPLEKEDLEEFKNTLNQHFDYNEFKNVFDHPDLNKLLENKDNISYEYAFTILNLLESECKNKQTNENINKIKSMLFEQQNTENKGVVFNHNIEKKNGKEKLLVSAEKIHY